MQVDPGNGLGLRDNLVRVTLQAVECYSPLSPVPDLANPELAVDLELVEPARGPHHFNAHIRSFGIGDLPEHVALVALVASLRPLVLLLTRTIGSEFDPAIPSPPLDHTSTLTLD